MCVFSVRVWVCFIFFKIVVHILCTHMYVCTGLLYHPNSPSLHWVNDLPHALKEVSITVSHGNHYHDTHAKVRGTF